MNNMHNKREIGKYMAYILRHKPEEIGIELDPYGYANVEAFIQGIQKKYDFSMEQLKEIVSTDEKNRYAFNDDKTKIRANQGHSIQVDVELKEAIPPTVLYHGTGEKYVKSIESIGLIPKSRLYVHLSIDIDTAIMVGKRHGKPVVYTIDTKQMIEDGYQFYVSINGVWLTKEVPFKFLEKLY